MTSATFGRLLHRATSVRHQLAPDARFTFVANLAPGSRLLDVGCGGHSPSTYLGINPHLRYVGIDITADGLSDADHAAAEEIVVVAPDDFSAAINRWHETFDALVSSHNLEHVDDLEGCLAAMFEALRPGGRAHLSFPSAASVDFPARAGCLNFYDDPTHQQVPDPEAILGSAQRHGMTVERRIDRHRPLVPRVIGRVLEPLSARRAAVLPGTWAYWGFETILILRKP